jgi:hypothetical protein
MTLDLWVPVTIACSGRTRTLPLLSMAAALRADTQRLEVALRALLGLGEYAEFSSEHSTPVSTEVLSTDSLSTQYSRTNSPIVPRSVHSVLESDSEPALHRAALNPPEIELSTDSTDSAESTDSTERDERANSGRSHDPAEFARALADVLDAPESLHIFEHLATKHPEALITEALGHALRTPGAKIVTTRAALFIAIVRRLARDPRYSPSHSLYAPPPSTTP